MTRSLVKRLWAVGLAAVAGLACVGGPGTPEAVAACTATKSAAFDNPGDANTDGGVGSDQWLAQSFKATASITVSKVSLLLFQFGSTTDSITVQIRPDSGGKPSGAILGTRTRTLTDTNSTTTAFADFDFSSDNISLAQGATYYIVATNSTPTSTDGYGWRAHRPSTYADGSTFISNDSGMFWQNDLTTDELFQVWAKTCTADTQPGGQNQSLAVASNLGFSFNTFAAENSGPPATNARKQARRGTKVSFRLNEAASVRFTVTQRAKGRRVKRGKKTICVKPTKKNRKRKRCTRVVTLKGSFSRTGVAGKNSFHFTGRLNGRKLKPGRYRLVATPTAGGKRGKPTSRGFRIVR
jgi:hypothetical protein